MEIYVLRHGIAENGRPGHPDSERALTAEGKDKLRKVMKRAKAAGVEPELILSSPYKRAIETAEIAAEVLGYAGKIVRTPGLIPDASPAEIWDEIRSRRNEPSILLSSHEPLTGSLVAFLLNSAALQVDMKKAALARIDCDSFGAAPSGVLKWLLTPGISD